MESNWRFNVWDLGMYWSDWELCAGISGDIGGYWVKRTLGLGFWRASYYIAFPGSLPALIGSIIYPNSVRFPAGVEVDPDN